MATQFDRDKRALEEREREEDYTYFGAIGKNLEREEATKDPPFAESPVAKPWPRYEDTWDYFILYDSSGYRRHPEVSLFLQLIWPVLTKHLTLLKLLKWVTARNKIPFYFTLAIAALLRKTLPDLDPRLQILAHNSHLPYFGTGISYFILYPLGWLAWYALTVYALFFTYHATIHEKVLQGFIENILEWVKISPFLLCFWFAPHELGGPYRFWCRIQISCLALLVPCRHGWSATKCRNRAGMRKWVLVLLGLRVIGDLWESLWG